MSAPPIKLTTTRTIGEATLLCDALKREGIEVQLRGEHRASIAGELPMADAEVELWVPAADEARARAVLAASRTTNTSDSVSCEGCGELSPRNFELCWSCQRPLTGRIIADVPKLEPRSHRALVIAGAVLGLSCAAIGYFAGARAPHFEDRATVSRWNLAKTCFEEVRRGSGIKVGEFCDENQDGFFEVSRRYAPSGWVQSEAYDTDNSGAPERYVSFSPSGRTSELFDADENGVIERQLIYGPDGKSVIEELLDGDQNGRNDKSIETRPEGLTVTWYDTDQNGTFEKREVSSNGVVILTELDQGAAGFARISAR